MSKEITSSKNAVGLKVFAYFTIIISAAYIATFVPYLDSIFYYFIIAFLLTFFFLRSEGKSLRSLGFIPGKSIDWKHFFAGTVAGIIAMLLTACITIWLNQSELKFTGHVDPVYIIVLILVNLWSSFVQEFTYRGYPFQALLKAYGPWVAQLFITIPFALMHLKLSTPFTLNQFLMTWLTTGLGSVLYGLCYIKTGKLLLSIGLHMGWNIAQALVPRSPEQSKTVLLELYQQSTTYHPLNVLLPYIGITLLMISVISFLTLKRIQKKPQHTDYSTNIIG